eukprot:CAMPEP_0116871178 /NCGR_PEP_ID=MMETSP0463-20121206/1415_1 /TAXON_ID=181622 /ORGANISM="Strombidinopsis sp, Strain SopsisLIS2011" /LENGTH=35 /DNA_ID= /DNA_START= /DNA_END= /DNA_ORIENTATION=
MTPLDMKLIKDVLFDETRPWPQLDDLDSDKSETDI